MTLSRNEYRVLAMLLQQECTNKMKSFTVNRLSELTHLSISKVRVGIRKFKSLGFVEEGVWQHNAKTYYITEQGINEVKELYK